MSEINLIAFGCLVTFIAVAGAYLYLREAFTVREETKPKAKQHPEAIAATVRAAG